MKLSRILPFLLLVLIPVLGVAAEFPHHDDHEEEAHADMGETLDGHSHFQLIGLTARVVHFGPALVAESIEHHFLHSFPLPPLFPFERPPKSHLS